MKTRALPSIRLVLLPALLMWVGTALVPAPHAFADRLILKGGVEREGEFISEDEDSVKFKTSIMTMDVPKDRIEEIIRETPIPVATPSPTSPPSGIQVYSSPTPSATPKSDTPTPRPMDEIAEEPEDPDRERFGRISAVKGDVTLRRPGGDWEKPRIGTIVYFDDEVRSANGRVRIVENDKWDVRTMEGTEIQPIQDDMSPAVNLRQGKVWSQIEKLQAEGEVKYRVRTPNAVAGVRGTLFAVEHARDGQSRIAVFEGEVAAANEDVAQAVRPNQAAIFRTEEYIGLVPAPPDEKDEWDFWDDWQAEVEAIGNQFMFGGNVIKGLGAQIAAEGKMAEQMLDERREAVYRQQVGRALDELKQGILRYQRDMGQLPPPDEFWQSLKYNIGGPGWQGPYIPTEQNLPLVDRWGTPIREEVAQTAGGRSILRLVSAGPNKRYDQGRADDIVTIVTALPEAPANPQDAPGQPQGAPGQQAPGAPGGQGQPGQQGQGGVQPLYDPDTGYYYYPDQGY